MTVGKVKCRQRKVTKSKSVFSMDKKLLKILYPAMMDIKKMDRAEPEKTALPAHLQVNHYKFENPAHFFSKPKEFSRELFCALISRLIYQSLFQAPQALSYRGIFLLERSL